MKEAYSIGIVALFGQGEAKHQKRSYKYSLAIGWRMRSRVGGRGRRRGRRSLVMELILGNELGWSNSE